MARREIKQSVLVLDDEPLILRYLNSCLQAEGFTTVTQARSGADARAAFQARPYSIFITDVYLGDIDGREVAQEFLEQNPDGQVLLMTGFAPEDLELPEPLRGRVQVLEKPFSSERLLELLSRGESFTPSEPEYHPVLSAPQTHLAVAAC